MPFNSVTITIPCSSEFHKLFTHWASYVEKYHWILCHILFYYTITATVSCRCGIGIHSLPYMQIQNWLLTSRDNQLNRKETVWKQTREEHGNHLLTGGNIMCSNYQWNVCRQMFGCSILQSILSNKLPPIGYH